MNPSRQAASPRERELFMQALEQPSREERAVFLDRACGDDSALRRRLQTLLARFERIGGFLDQPVVSVVARAGGATASNGVSGEPTAPLPVTEKPGDHIGRYKLREKIGEGGCGLVYVADQEEPVRRRVALKVIKLGMDTREVVARFEAERQALALMDHPYIARVFDAGSTETGRPFFVMELVRGIKITDYCDQNALSTQERLDLFIQVCHAIQHAHQKGIIHRDIKPSNVLVTLHDGVPVPKVIDFGIAKAMEQKLTEKTVYTAFGQFIGTPAYTSPEQVEMSGLDIDTRSDIYALGVLLYELLTGKTPFDGKELLASGLEAMRRTIREKEPVRPSTRLRTMLYGERSTTAERRRTEAPRLIHLLRGDLDWIVMKCLEKDRTRRYDTANGLAMDIEHHLNNEPVVARPPGRAYRMQKFVWRNKVMVAAASAVAVALVLGMAGSIWQAIRATRAEQDQSRLLTQAQANEQKAHAAEANEATLRKQAQAEAYASDVSLAYQALDANDLGRARALLHRHRPHPGETDLRHWEWRYLWQRCRSDSLYTLCQESNRVNTVVFSADGGHLAVRDSAGKVALWDVAERKKIAEVQQASETGALAFSPQGQLLASATVDAGGQAAVTLWDGTLTRPVAMLKHGGPVKSVAFSPDGKLLASFATDKAVRLWNVETTTLVTNILIPSLWWSGVVVFSPDGRTLAIGDVDGWIRLLDWASGETKVISAHRERTDVIREGISALAFSFDGKILASASVWTGREIRLWNPRTGELIGRLSGHTAYIDFLAFAPPDGRILASAGGDRTLRLWDVGTQRELAILRGHEDEVQSVAFTPNGERLASGCKDGTVCFWDPQRRPRPEGSPSLPGSVAWNLAFSPDGKKLVSAPLFAPGSLRSWNLATLQPTPLPVDTGTNNKGGVAISPDGRLLVAGDEFGTLHVWDLETRHETTNFVGHSGPVGLLKFGARGRFLISDCEGDRPKLWEVNSWRERTPWKGNTNVVLADCSLDGQTAISGQRDGTISFWDTSTGREEATLRGHKSLHPLFRSAMAVSPDGRTLATGSVEAPTLKLWDIGNRREMTSWPADSSGHGAVVFSPDGRRMATGQSEEHAVTLWDVQMQRDIATLKGQGTFPTVGFSPDGNTIVGINAEGRVHLWRAPSWAEIEAAEAQQAKDSQAH
jgi:eukaryotic-like serine/threonine-protein kinase